MKIFHLLSLLLLLSSCSILEDEVFKNTDNQAMLEEEDIINDKKAPPFSFFRALQSVEREEIEISNEYNRISEKPLGYTAWIGHSSFIINNYDLNIITDPIFSNRASPLSFLGPKRLIIFIKMIEIKFSFQVFKKSFKFSIPQLPQNLLGLAHQSFDKMMLANWLLLCFLLF